MLFSIFINLICQYEYDRASRPKAFFLKRCARTKSESGHMACRNNEWGRKIADRCYEKKKVEKIMRAGNQAD